MREIIIWLLAGGLLAGAAGCSQTSLRTPNVRGCLEGNCLDGTGTLTWPNGDQ